MHRVVRPRAVAFFLLLSATYFLLTGCASLNHMLRRDSAAQDVSAPAGAPADAPSLQGEIDSEAADTPQMGGKPSLPGSAPPGRSHYVPGLVWYPKAQLIGRNRDHLIAEKETLLDIARFHNLGYNELVDLYPHIDPWMPPKGEELLIPSQRILPDVPAEGIVINTPEMRLYYFTARNGRSKVLTFPIGVGGEDYPTPVGTYAIYEKRTHPVWYIPPSLQRKYGAKTMPPGPDNPLGDYMMKLGYSDYGIHGTNVPWSIGRMATHGCIRLYPEDIRRLFPMVKPGTKVRLLYQPVKVAQVNGRVFIEVHRDVYGKVGDLRRYAENLLLWKDLYRKVDRAKLHRVVQQQNGLPVDITRG
ncbi:MAG: L,D-transpeptidase family protein [Desulfobulbaceae bacterium]|nr:MAG: L,D-transpeptidase family protein [Desulfobulbaceae bacterium]